MVSGSLIHTNQDHDLFSLFNTFNSSKYLTILKVSLLLVILRFRK